MAKIDEFALRVNPVGTDILYLVGSGSDFRVTLATLFGGVSTPLRANSLFSIAGVVQNITNSGTIDASSNIAHLSADSPVAVDIDGGTIPGQIKIIAYGGMESVVLSSPNTQFDRIVFDTQGQTATLQWINGVWWCIATTGTLDLTPEDVTPI